MYEFERERYKNNIVKSTEIAASFLGEYAFGVLSSDIDLLIDVIRDMLVVNKSKKGKKIPPSIDYDSLFVDETPKGLIQQLRLPKPKNVFNSGGEYNNQLLKLFDYQLERFSSKKEKLKYLHELITLRTDVACRIKFFSNAYAIDSRVPGYINLMKKCCTKENFKICSDCLDIRTKYIGHFKPYQYNELSVKKYRSELGLISKTIFKIPKSVNSERIIEKRNILKETIARFIEESNNAPISNEYLTSTYKGYEYSEDYILFSELKSDYDISGKTLFWHTEEEVERIIKDKYERKRAEKKLKNLRNENEELSQENVEIKTWIQMAPIGLQRKILERSNREVDNHIVDASNQHGYMASEEPSEPQQIGRDKLLSLVLPAMKSLIDNSEKLSNRHLEEVAEKTTVIAAADFWANDKGRSFLAREMAPMLSKYGRKILIDWSTRVELYKVEINDTNTYSEDEIRLARVAHNVMHMMASKDFVQYMPKTNSLYSSEQRIMNIAKEHPESIFCVFTNSSSFVDNAIKDGINNIVPISMLPTGTPTIRLSAKPLLKLCFSPNSETDNNKDKVLNLASVERSVDENDKNDVIFRQEVKDVVRDSILNHDFQIGTSIKIDDGKLIDVKITPKSKDTVYDSEQKPIQLAEKIGSGGEGSIYLTDIKGKVAKIYNKNKLTEMKKHKLEVMVSSGIRIEKLCLPESLLYTSEGAFTGYLMTDASSYMEMGCSVLKIKNENIEKGIMHGWDRLALVELCVDMCQTFKRMQEKGILMGDINPCNIMINPESKDHTDYVFVDCDSYQFNGFPCPVGTIIFTSPKVYERNNLSVDRIDFGKILRTPEDENYAIASLLFHILMLNESPFAGKGVTNMEQAIRNYNFSYRLPEDEDNTGAETPDGDGRLIWNNTPKSIKVKFGRVFKFGEDIAIDEWITELTEYKHNIELGTYTRDLKPNNYWDTNDNKYTTFFTCDSCGEYRNEPKERYEKEEDYNLPHLCARCTQSKFSMKRKIEKVKCVRCGVEYDENRWNIWLAQKGYRKLTCPSCRELVSATCARCGKAFQLPKYKYEYETKVLRRMPWCQDCKEDAGKALFKEGEKW